MNKNPTLKLAIAIAAASALSIHAEEANDEKPVEEVFTTGTLNRYGATKSDIPILETARSVSVIDEKFFRDIGALTVDDTVAYTSGVIGDSFGFSTRGDFIKVRGFDAAEYRDGQQVLFGFYNNTRSDVYFLEQVEVLKGPASVLYGKGTPGGIVNAISKLAGPEKDNEVLVDVGNQSRKQVGADLNFSLTDSVYARIVSLYRESDTQIDYVNDDLIGIMPSITYQNENTSVTGFLEYIDRKSDTSHQFLPLNATGCLNDDVSITPISFCANANASELDASTYIGHPDFNRYDSSSTLLSLLGSHAFNETVELEGVVRYKNADMDYRQAWLDFNGSGVPRIDANGNGSRTYYISDARTEQLAVDLRLRLDLDTGPLEHELVFGLAYQDVETENDLSFGRSQDVINVQNIVNGPVPDAFTSGDTAADNPASEFEDQGMYVSDQISLDNWKINIGIRYDDVDSGTEGEDDTQNDSEVSKSLGVLYAFENGLSPYISYAESFEPVIGEDSVTMDQLKPREGEQVEIGIKYQPEGHSTYITFAYFDIEESNLPNPSALIGQVSSQQEGVGSSEGFELEGFIKFGDFDVKSSLTIMDTKSAEGVAFDSIPEELFSTWINYTPSGDLNGLKAGFGLRYVGPNQSNAVAADVKVETDGYTIADAMVGYDFDQLSLSLNVRNLTNEDYYSTCLARGDCFPGEELTAVARAVYRF